MDKELPYELIEKVSSGAQSVYKAKDETGRLVSVKAASKASLSPEMRERFLREVSICSSFDHPHVVRVEDSEETADSIYHVTEWLEGMTLAEVLKQKLAVSWDQKLDIMEQVCSGLEYAHSRGVLHRDIKPANIFLEGTGRVRLLDFGMARTQESDLTVSGLSPGTLTYMSPEQVRGEQATEASDIFCAGIVFYELATGFHPFATPGSNVAAMLSAILFRSPTPLKQLARDAPDGVDLILNQSLEKDPGKRYVSAHELKKTIAMCRTLLQGGAYKARPPAGGIDVSETLVLTRARAESAPLVQEARPAVQPVPQKFCPHCTCPNKPEATVCATCSMPLGEAAAPPPTAPAPKNWVLIVTIVSVVLLAAVLVLMLRPAS